MIKTPAFWYNTNTWRARALAGLLTPASLVYRAGHYLHYRLSKPYNSTLPVICCGNLVAGGAGKTPTAIAIYRLIVAHNLADAPVFLTRGYAGKDTTPRRIRYIETDKPDAGIIGDEARLLSIYGDCIVAGDRAKGAKTAEKHGYDCIIMDDGLQHRRLHKDLSLCIIDGLNGFGNQRLLPAGPLREPLSSGLQRCDAFVLIGPDQHNVRTVLPSDRPCYTGAIVSNAGHLDKQVRYIAFCGIGNPDKFRMSLETAGLNIKKLYSYADHHTYTVDEITVLRREAEEKNAQLITTEKDMMRLAAIGEMHNIATFPVYIEINENNALIKELNSVTKNK